MAYGPQDDFAAIDLNRAPLDLSDRNVDGRAAPSQVDAYVYFDRGIYRPGETVHISGLLRNDAGLAIADRPVTVTVRRPNYTEAEKFRIEKSEVGGFAQDFEVPSSAPRGSPGSSTPLSFSSTMPASCHPSGRSCASSPSTTTQR